MTDVDDWVKQEQAKHRLCRCGCGKEIKILNSHYYKRGIPQYYKTHRSPMNEYNDVNEWVKQEQGKHFCYCGCGNEITIKRMHHKPGVGIPQYIFRHTPNSGNITKFINSENGKHFCNCGCGQEIIIKKHHFNNGIPKYIKGHMKPSEHTRRKMSEQRIGKKPSIETRKRMSKAQEGNTNSKGITRSEEYKKNLSETRKGKKLSEEHKKKISMGSPHLSGKYHPNWQGGISFEPYCHKFNNQLKERIRDRDNRTCQNCGYKENGNKLTCHHIHYDRENCYPDLIALCVSCNSKANTNKEYWENYYMNILNKRGLLNWSCIN
ncbi:MAG: NUMOD3 domain-containing DNA-binding protein [Methanosarcinaceae archaeon]